MLTQGSGKHILLIDDEVEFAVTLAERLTLRGYAASVAADGEEGLARLEQENFDFVLLDMMLPGIRGLDVLQRIRQKQPNLPVILLTGNAAAKDGIQGMKQGARGYLIKPVDLQELLELIEGYPTGVPYA